MKPPNYSNVKDKIKGIKTEFLWVVVVLAGLLFYTSLVPLEPNDYWWHLRIGQLISAEHTIPTSNLFSWTVPTDQPFFYGAWLGEWLLYSLYHAGGLHLTIFARNFIVALTLFLVALEAHRRTGSWRFASFALALAGMMCTNNLLVRPQMWALLPFTITYSLLCQYQAGKLRDYWLIFCPILMTFWVNVHGSFVLGLGLVGIFLTGEILNSFSNERTDKTRKRLFWLAGIGGLSALSVMANPQTYKIYSYVLKLLTDPPSQKLIEEWQSPAPHGLANTVFFFTITLFLASLAFKKIKINPTQLISLVAFMWLAWSGQRYVVWYAIATMPWLSDLILHIKLPLPKLQSTRNPINALIAILIFVPVLLAQPWFVEHIPLPASYWAQVQNDPDIGPLLSQNTPINASRYLQANPGRKIFNEMGFGSYLIWALPNQKIFIDPRVELYPFELWEKYIDISNGVRSIELLYEFSVDRVMLSTSLQPELSIALAESSNWQREYVDSNTEIWKLIH